MSEKQPSRPTRDRPLLEGYQPTDGKGYDPKTGKLDLSRLKLPKWGSAIRPPGGTSPQPPKDSGGDKSS